MALVFSTLIELITVICAGGVLFAGMMRTTGSGSADTRTAWMVLICGTSIAALLAISHWVGW